MRKVDLYLIAMIIVFGSFIYWATSQAEQPSISNIEAPNIQNTGPINGGSAYILDLDPPIQFPDFKFTQLQMVAVEYPLFLFGITARLTDNDSASTQLSGTCEWRVKFETLDCILQFSNFILVIQTDLDLTGDILICSQASTGCETSVRASRSDFLSGDALTLDQNITSRLCHNGSTACTSSIRLAKQD